MTGKQKLLRVAVVLCLLVAAKSIYGAYYKHYPVASEGECVKVTDDHRVYIKLKILKNSSAAGLSLATAEIETILGPMKMTGPISYEELRDLNAEKVSCDAQVN